MAFCGLMHAVREPRETSSSDPCEPRASGRGAGTPFPPAPGAGLRQRPRVVQHRGQRRGGAAGQWGSRRETFHFPGRGSRPGRCPLAGRTCVTSARALEQSVPASAGRRAGAAGEETALGPSMCQTAHPHPGRRRCARPRPGPARRLGLSPAGTSAAAAIRSAPAGRKPRR